MRPNAVAAWRLRADSFRVYYDVEGDAVKLCQVARNIGARFVTPTGEELRHDRTRRRSDMGDRPIDILVADGTLCV